MRKYHVSQSFKKIFLQNNTVTEMWSVSQSLKIISLLLECFFLLPKVNPFCGKKKSETNVGDLEGPKRRPEGGGGEWEPIKILLKNLAYVPKSTRTPLF
jgi:hypothetical protein